MGDIPLWTSDTRVKNNNYRNYCVVSVLAAFGVGFLVGILIPSVLCSSETLDNVLDNHPDNLARVSSENFAQNSRNSSWARTWPENNNSTAYNFSSNASDKFSTVTFVENDGLIEDGVFWGRKVEQIVPKGFKTEDNSNWDKYVQKSTAVRLEPGCGRMQNRLVTFQDGTKGCVRYRQNLDQIQGELFSFYLAQLLELPNLAPSTVSLVDLRSITWGNLQSEISSAQWSSNRPVVVTKYIPDLSSANIPQGFRPPETHLSQTYVLDVNFTNPEKLREFAELAQWSDLVIFDYLTANLDRVVNNLYNRQWNANIMEAPAHNLAKREDNLLVFLDNESGLLHGYRLLHKYEPYHSLLLDNLCIFRKRTVAALEKLRRDKNVGRLLTEMFEKKTGGQIRDVLPPLPEKSVKVLNERLDRVHGQISRCRRGIKGL